MSRNTRTVGSKRHKRKDPNMPRTKKRKSPHGREETPLNGWEIVGSFPHKRGQGTFNEAMMEAFKKVVSE